ncbi:MULTISPECIES: Fe-S protein assembly co-chaperone HscB [unclassified Thioalkalivibrio]|uniref:Fe-S protein assembly co-chaperone HscB n=1 Tax=unclassified Thioalkalivibrio TaxID=2621013 RepID=UPI00037A8EFB|nr:MULTISPECIES: Fe-S protein assembly co-chaperone HscB [unclassified Thioalkalivibrio]
MNDPFEQFDLPVAFEVDRQQLDERFRRLQAELHPDRFVRQGDQARRMAAAVAADVNEAYAILGDDYRRAVHLLERTGVAFDPERDTSQDIEFIQAQIEWRERLEETAAAGDLTALEAVATELAQARAEARAKVADALKEPGTPAPDAKDRVLELRFFDRLLEETKRTRQNLARGK